MLMFCTRWPVDVKVNECNGMQNLKLDVGLTLAELLLQVRDTGGKALNLDGQGLQ